MKTLLILQFLVTSMLGNIAGNDFTKSLLVCHDSVLNILSDPKLNIFKDNFSFGNMKKFTLDQTRPLRWVIAVCWHYSLRKKNRFIERAV
jgi:hypothetical protein